MRKQMLTLSICHFIEKQQQKTAIHIGIKCEGIIPQNACDC